MQDQHIVGVDIGGTKIKIAIVRDGQILKLARLNTPAHEAKETVIDTVIKGIYELSEGYPISGIGIGTPGLIDEKNGIVYDVTNIPSWNEVHLTAIIEKQLNCKTCLTNDANTFVLGEKYYGKGKNYDNFVGITLGTGLGVGFIINGQLYSGQLSSAGELAVIPYLHHNYEYYCSGQFFKNEFNITGEEVFKKAMDGDVIAQKLYHQYGQHLGHLIKHILHVLAPEAVFFGGSIKEAFPLFKSSMWDVLNTFPYKRVLSNLTIEKSDMDDIAVLGAAALFQMRSITSDVASDADFLVKK